MSERISNERLSQLIAHDESSPRGYPFPRPTASMLLFDLRELRIQRDQLIKERDEARDIIEEWQSVGGSPMEGDFKCDQCAIKMKPPYLAALLRGRVFLAKYPTNPAISPDPGAIQEAK